MAHGSLQVQQSQPSQPSKTRMHIAGLAAHTDWLLSLTLVRLAAAHALANNELAITIRKSRLWKTDVGSNAKWTQHPKVFLSAKEANLTQL